MSKIRVETISVDEAIKRIGEAYVGKEGSFKIDLNNAMNAAQERVKATEQIVEKDTTRKPRM